MDAITIENTWRHEDMFFVKLYERSEETINERRVTVLKNDDIKCTCTLFNTYELVCPHVMKAVNHLKMAQKIDQQNYVALLNMYYPKCIRVGSIHSSIKEWNFDHFKGIKIAPL